MDHFPTQAGWCPQRRLPAVPAAVGALGVSRQRRRAAGAGDPGVARGAAAAAARLVRAKVLEACGEPGRVITCGDK